MSWKRTLTTGILGSAVLFSTLAISSGTALARDNDCREKAQRQEQKLDQAIRRHGERSRQADNERTKLRQIRERCRDNDRDRDRDRDHDRDHDHDHDNHYNHFNPWR